MKDKIYIISDVLPSFNSLVISLSFLGSLIARIFGGWSTAMTTLIIFMVIDYFFGMTNAIVFKNSPKTVSGTLSSNEGLKGLCKKVFMLLLVFIAHRIDVTFDFDYVKTMVCIALILNELISILETYKLTGLSYPPILDKVIDIIKDNTEKKD